jgi:hypothetical protein
MDEHDDEIFEPTDVDIDHAAEAEMAQGRADLNPEYDLRDPWFHTDEGKAWLAERGES